MNSGSTFRFDDIRLLVRDILVYHGTPDDIADVVSDSLTQAEGKGVLSHGIMRLPSYIGLISERVLDSKARPKITQSGVSSLIVDGRHGFGMFLGRETARAASTIAAKTGICLAIGKNLNHLGMLEYFSELPARDGFITIAMTNAHPTVAYPGGKEATIGTNPISISIPSAEGPFNLDMAISKSSLGMIREAALEGRKIPDNIALDKEGNDTTDPIAALTGSLLPFGGIKGYALGMVVDILAGILSGSAAGKEVVTWNTDGKKWNSGLFLLSISPTFFIPMDHFEANVAQYLERNRTYSPLHRVPGDRRRQNLFNSQNNGLRIKAKTLDSLISLTKKTGLKFPDCFK